MASLPKDTIEHFTHPRHPLTEFNDDTEYLCDGCKTPGSGKRYRCRHGFCNFDLHEYCGTCPQSLSSFMHPHRLTLVMRKAVTNRLNNRVCSVCWDSVEGLFYRCKDCDFDLHPMCSQLPEQLRHVLHQVHPLRLENPSIPSACGVCGSVCASWRYRCGQCGFDIHMECVLVVPRQETNHRGGPQFVPPPAAFRPQPAFYPPPVPPPYFGYPSSVHGGFHPYGFPFPPPYNMYPNNWAGPQPHQAPGAARPPGLGRRMFALVGELGAGVLSNLIFGIDFTSFMS